MQASVQPSSNLASTVQSSAGTNATIAEPSLHPEPTGLFLFLPAGIALGRVRSVALDRVCEEYESARLAARDRSVIAAGQLSCYAICA